MAETMDMYEFAQNARTLLHRRTKLRWVGPYEKQEEWRLAYEAARDKFITNADPESLLNVINAVSETVYFWDADASEPRNDKLFGEAMSRVARLMKQQQ